MHSFKCVFGFVIFHNALVQYVSSFVLLLVIFCGHVAQLAEQQTFNLLVPGSIPGVPIFKFRIFFIV